MQVTNIKFHVIPSSGHHAYVFGRTEGHGKCNMCFSRQCESA